MLNFQFIFSRMFVYTKASWLRVDDKNIPVLWRNVFNKWYAVIDIYIENEEFGPVFYTNYQKNHDAIRIGKTGQQDTNSYSNEKPQM